MKRLALALLILGCLTVVADAANRFWSPLTVTNAVSGTGGLCRLTVNGSAGLLAGDAVIVTAIVGAVACNGTTTVTTVVDATTVEINLAFGAGYTSGGRVGGGRWTSTNTANWATTSGGAGGAAVPTGSDSITFDGNSGGSTVIVAFGGTISYQAFTIGAFTGTWDNSINNNNMTGGGWSGTGTATRTIKLGTATYSIDTSGSGFVDWTATTGLTLVAGSETWAWTGSQVRTFHTGGKSFGTMALNGNNGSQFPYQFFESGSTFANLTWNGQTVTMLMSTSAMTMTITNAVNLVGSKTGFLYIRNATIGTAATMNLAASSTMSYVSLRDMTFTGSPVANNSMNGGNVSGITINGLTPGGGSCILGGWLLWRDLPNHLNDNFPAWLDKAS